MIHRYPIARVCFHAAMAVAVLGLLACSRSSTAEPTTPPPTADRERPGLDRRSPLPALARDLLGQHMMEHGDSMENLLWSALMLDHPMTEAVVEQMLSQPRLSRPSGDANTINQALPDRFYELQDQFYEAAQQLKSAAASRDDIGTAQAYARLAETCVTCHALYLALPAEAAQQ